MTRPAKDGVSGTGAGSLSAASMFESLSNELFNNEPHKVSYLSHFNVDYFLSLEQA